MAVMKTPGVYIVEKNAFPNSVVEVATAVPAFIGYTAKAVNAGTSLAGMPFKIGSMAEFERYYGGPAPVRFAIKALAAAPAQGPLALPAPNGAGAARAVKALAAAEAAVASTSDAADQAAERAAVAKIALAAAQAGKAVADKAVGDAKGAAKAAAAKAQKAAADRLAQATDESQAADAASAIAAAAKTAAVAVRDGANAASLVFAPPPGDGKDKALVPAAAGQIAPVPLSQDFIVKDAAGEDHGYGLAFVGTRYRLYQAMRHFFQNGGGPCYIVSVGEYPTSLKPGESLPPLSKEALKKGIEALQLEQEPTMVVIPDAVGLDGDDKCIDVQQAMLRHCGDVMKNRIAILDIYDGYKDLSEAPNTAVDRFRNQLGVDFLQYGAAYYPWVNTTLVEDTDLSYLDFEHDDIAGLFLPGTDDDAFASVRADLRRSPDDWLQAAVQDGVPEDRRKASIEFRQTEADKALRQASPAYVAMLKSAARKLSLMPPSAAMAGVYTSVDNNRGVWKAPANVTIAGVVSPAVNISHFQQQDLNVHPLGKSINAIRSFIGEGVLVWGARTLDGNSLDWRYINVRRTMFMLEESCRLAAKAMVFEPNVASTWLTIKSMIQNFLTGIWKRGGLAGAVPEDAFSVFCGLGETMTSEDILEGILRVTVLVAVSRPAEFIEITFQQQMQKS